MQAENKKRGGRMRGQKSGFAHDSKNTAEYK